MRYFILSIILLFSSAELAYACSMGMAVNFVEGLPPGFHIKHSIASQPKKKIKRLVRHYLQRKDWRYASADYVIQAAEIAENPAVVPVTVKNTGAVREKFSRVVILLERNIRVLDPNMSGADIPNRKRQLPLDYQLPTRSASSVMLAATYRFPSGNPVLLLSQRFNFMDVESVNILVLMEPTDKSKPVQVIYHQKSVRIYSCDTTIYVDGPMTDW
ncbi:MAG: hypothetical protein P8Y60_13075, partial [Calditrichota bacterium]